MNDPNAKQDDALDAWLVECGRIIAEESQLTDQERTQLVDRIMFAANERQSPLRRNAIDHRKTDGIRRAVGATLIAACLLMVVVMASWRMSDPTEVTTKIPEPTAPEFAERHRDRMLIIAEHEQVFGIPLAWYLERGNQVRFELADDRHDTKIANHTMQRQELFAELRIEKIENAETDRQSQAETLFLMTRGEQVVEPADDRSERPKLLLWLCPVDENLFAYELAMNENNGMQFNGETVGLIEADKSTPTLSVEQNGVEYQVYLQIHTSTT